MNDTPFSPGGIIPSGGPGSDLIPALILKGEAIGVPHLVRDWLASGLSLEEWKRWRDQGGTDGGAG